MTPDGFRRIALGMDGVTERAHHGHPDFRVGGRVFATLGYPDRRHGMVVLTPEQQRAWVHEHPAAFVPVKGAWGEQGCTMVRLEAVGEDELGEAITLAWQNGMNKKPVRATRTLAPKAKTASRRAPKAKTTSGRASKRSMAARKR